MTTVPSQVDLSVDAIEVIVVDLLHDLVLVL
jgi:hypothetical protein